MAHGSLHQFKAFLERRNARKDKNEGRFEKNAEDYKASNSKPEYDFPKVSAEELERIKADIRSRKNREKSIQLIILAVIILALFGVYLYYA